jgi:hypothetical protein
MRTIRTLIAVLTALAAGPAFAAAATWTTIGSSGLSAIGVCAAGTSCDAPTATTDGISLANATVVDVYVCADASQTITDGDGFDVYFYDARVIGGWAKFNLTPYKAATGRRCAYVQGDSPGKGFPILARPGRMVVVPTSAAVSSGGLTIYLLASNASGIAL